MSKRTLSELRNIISFCGGVILDANDYTVSELKDIVKDIASTNDSHIILKNVSRFTALELKNIVKIGSKKIILDFS